MSQQRTGDTTHGYDIAYNFSIPFPEEGIGSRRPPVRHSAPLQGRKAKFRRHPWFANSLAIITHITFRFCPVGIEPLVIVFVSQ